MSPMFFDLDKTKMMSVKTVTGPGILREKIAIPLGMKAETHRLLNTLERYDQ